jgi:hypothetical protein
MFANEPKDFCSGISAYTAAYAQPYLDVAALRYQYSPDAVGSGAAISRTTLRIALWQ